MIKAVTGLTAAYVLAIGITFSVFVGSSDSAIVSVAVAEAIFSFPMVFSSLLALIMRRAESYRVLLVFEILFSAISLLIIFSTFAGEHDAQYQLVLLVIPLVGFPGVIIAGLLAAFSTRRRN